MCRDPINARELLDGYAKPPCKATTINYSLPIGLTPSEINRPNTRQNMTVSIVKSSQTDVRPAEVIEQDSQLDNEVENDRLWIVLVWNDPINLMSYVELDVYRLHEHGLWATMQREDAP
jgi:hypothetical protein